MRITLNDFKEFATTKALHQAGLHAIPRAHAVMGKFYCDRMTNRSLCPKKCSECKLMIARSIDQLETTTNSYAVFTYRIKNEVAKATDLAAKSHKAVTPKNVFGEVEEVDVMDKLMEAFA